MIHFYAHKSVDLIIFMRAKVPQILIRVQLAPNLDEPQKMEGGKTLDSQVNFKPLMVLRYSATHNKIHRLDALDAYNQKLVKKIAVRGITVKGLAGTSGYLYSNRKNPPMMAGFLFRSLTE